MRLYRWEQETMVPDNALNTQLGVHTTFVLMLCRT